MTGARCAQVERSYEDEIEVFVHGALCVSYSGQCFSSEAWSAPPPLPPHKTPSGWTQPTPALRTRRWGGALLT